MGFGLWSSTFHRLLPSLGWKSEAQDDIGEEKTVISDGGSILPEQHVDGKPKETQASTVAPKHHGEATTPGRAPTEKASGLKNIEHHRKEVVIKSEQQAASSPTPHRPKEHRPKEPEKQLDDAGVASPSPRDQLGCDKEVVVRPEQQPGEARAASTSPRQLEEATEKAELADEVKFQKQLAMGLLTFSAAAVIAAKATTFAKQPGSGGQQDSQRGFFFCVSVGLWFTSLLFSMSIILLNTFKEGSKGLVINSKIFNSSGICIAVVGVAFWIFA